MCYASVGGAYGVSDIRGPAGGGRTSVDGSDGVTATAVHNRYKLIYTNTTINVYHYLFSCNKRYIYFIAYNNDNSFRLLTQNIRCKFQQSFNLQY